MMKLATLAAEQGYQFGSSKPYNTIICHIISDQSMSYGKTRKTVVIQELFPLCLCVILVLLITVN